LVEDDFRALEIFPPPPRVASRGKSWVFEWWEDDGLSSAGTGSDKASGIANFKITYHCNETRVFVRVERVHASTSSTIPVDSEDCYTPAWMKNQIGILLPVGDERTVFVEEEGAPRIQDPRGEGSGSGIGRKVFVVPVL